MNRIACLLLVMALALIPVGIAQAHEMRPAYLGIQQTGHGDYDITWKVPGRGENLRMSLYVELPARCRARGESRAEMVGGAFTQRWSVSCGADLSGETVRIAGLNATATDVLARMVRLDGSVQVERLTPAAPALLIDAQPSAVRVARTYLALGVEHILRGVDHLLFVLALLLLVKGTRRLLLTVTAFTVAHSITLAAATLGVVHLPGPPVEAGIALSIAFVAAEIVRSRQGTAGITERYPWLVAFGFGLLHGLGFASALAEVGLPASSIPIALLLFNLGVEIGQLIFIAAALAAMVFLRSGSGWMRKSAAAWSYDLSPYVIGTLAMFWVIQRVELY